MENQKEILHIVKAGGRVVEHLESMRLFLKRFATLPSPKILVHGGGILATQLSEKLGISVQMIDGRRVTDSESLKVAVMVYAGWINKNIVSNLQNLGCMALGLTGADLNLIESVKRKAENIDYGWVGDIQRVNVPMLSTLLNQSITPVFSAITHDASGQLLNTNADGIASHLAIALSEKYETVLWYCFEKKGVMLDVEDENSLINTLDVESFKNLKDKKVIHSGMIPKLSNSFEALSKGVGSVVILHENELGKENYTGTKLVLKHNAN